MENREYYEYCNMNIDSRILDLAEIDAFVRAGVISARQNNLSEKEMLIRLVLMFVDVYKFLFDEFVKIQEEYYNH